MTHWQDEWTHSKAMSLPAMHASTGGAVVKKMNDDSSDMDFDYLQELPRPKCI